MGRRPSVTAVVTLDNAFTLRGDEAISHPAARPRTICLGMIGVANWCRRRPVVCVFRFCSSREPAIRAAFTT
jgi:hypothetical protein